MAVNQKSRKKTIFQLQQDKRKKQESLGAGPILNNTIDTACKMTDT